MGLEQRVLICLAAVLCLAATPAEPIEGPDTAFFGMNLGLGLARVTQPGLSPRLRPGLEYDAVFGFGLTDHWAAGIELATWQPLNLNGDPTHLHLFAWRIELAPRGLQGPVFATSLGLGVGDGSRTKRIGSGGVLLAGYRWSVTRWVTLAVETGAHGAVFTEGTALAPFVALQLRFYGLTGE